MNLVPLLWQLTVVVGLLLGIALVTVRTLSVSHHVGHCVQLAADAATIGMKFALLHVSPYCPAETVALGGEVGVAMAWTGGFLALALTAHIGTILLSRRVVAALARLSSCLGKVWDRLLGLCQHNVTSSSIRRDGVFERQVWVPEFTPGLRYRRGPPVRFGLAA
ncbi:hypothetical protein LWF01_02045 [Saxibacter everestensis]|uniref:Uncharacterized protein n=1 Tax=Saxibacter everestensis TaxID=2909229 RepID=A0ABY8QUI5_9MICO|nr:hypothetical protein LWF01_02045 [Brevibacteriaceae bacterium ZFBP1038]